jgi:chorismate mutase
MPDDAARRLDELRTRILEVDETLVRLVGERRALVLEVGRLKAALDLPVLDPAREAEVVRRAAELARRHDIDDELVRDVLWRIIASARDAQEGRTRWGPPSIPLPSRRTRTKADATRAQSSSATALALLPQGPPPIAATT